MRPNSTQRPAPTWSLVRVRNAIAFGSLVGSLLGGCSADDDGINTGGDPTSGAGGDGDPASGGASSSSGGASGGVGQAAGGTTPLGSGGSTLATGGSGSSSGGAAPSSGGSTGSDTGDDQPNGTESITIWLAGDSTVANGNTPCPSGWGKFFAKEFKDNVTVTNAAVGGRSVRSWLYDVTGTMGDDGECVINQDGSGNRVLQARWTDMLAAMDEGDYLFVQFGINDGDSTCNRHVGGAAFKEEYAMMARAAVERGVHPVFLTPVSMIRCSGGTAIGSRGFLTETFDVASAENVPVIDLHQLSVDLYAELGFCPIPGGDVSASTMGPVGDFFCDDHTHFSDLGAARVATLIADAVAEQELELALYLDR